MNTSISRNSRFSKRHLALITFVLLLVTASRMLRLYGLDMNSDEIWSVWQTLGTPLQILHWTPYDWPPLYYLLLGAWRGLVGIDPTALRMLSISLYLVGTCCVYRVVRRLRDNDAALIVTLVYAALGYSIYMGITVRGHIVAFALMPLALWLTLRYFTHPTLRRAVLLALCMAAMFYAYLTSVVGFAMLGLFTLIVYREQVWRWLLPGIIAGILAVPEFLSKRAIAFGRVGSVEQMPSLPLGKGLQAGFVYYTGSFPPLWLALLVGATVLALTVGLRRRSVQQHSRGVTLAFLAWIVGVPLALFITAPVLGFFMVPYSWWAVICLAFWIGWGLSYLPRPGLIAAGVLVTALAFSPIPIQDYKPYVSMATSDVQWLAQHMESGDVALIDPKCDCNQPDQWDYYTRLYFPNGLPFVSSPQGYRRVWYMIAKSGWTPDMAQTVQQGRVAGEEIGAAMTWIQLYEAPPDAKGIAFDNGIHFNGAELVKDPGQPQGNAFLVGEPLRLRLWWSADRQIDLDYSVTLYFTATAFSPALSIDGPPQVSDGPKETSRWVTGRYYVDSREIALPDPAAAGYYDLRMAVYQWWDNKRIAVTGSAAQSPQTDVTIGRYYIKAW